MQLIPLNNLICVVDWYGESHYVLLEEFKARKPVLATYFRTGRTVKETGARYKPQSLKFEAIDTIAVRSKKRNPLDDRIARKFRNCKTMAFC